jgi:hypothetical protein
MWYVYCAVRTNSLNTRFKLLLSVTQDSLYSQNVVRFQGKRANVTSVSSFRKVLPSLRRFSRKSYVQQHYVQIHYNNFNPYWEIIMESTRRNYYGKYAQKLLWKVRTEIHLCFK